MRTLGFLMVFVFLASTCKDDNKRVSSLYRYLETIQDIDLKEINYLIVHQAAFCNSCTDELETLIDEKVRSSPGSVHVLLSAYRKDYVDRYKSYPNVELMIDKDFAMEKYGLAISYDLIFVFTDGRVKDWSYISDDHINKINKF